MSETRLSDTERAAIRASLDRRDADRANRRAWAAIHTQMTRAIRYRGAQSDIDLRRVLDALDKTIAELAEYKNRQPPLGTSVYS